MNGTMSAVSSGRKRTSKAARSLLNSNKPRRVENRQYKKAWEEVPELRGWLTSVPGFPQRAFCMYCQISLRAHRRDLVDHSTTERHLRNSSESASAIAVENQRGVVVESEVPMKEEEDVEFLQENLYEFQVSQDIQPNQEDVPGTSTFPEQPTCDRKPDVTAITRAVRESQRQILVIQTGGTIDKDYPKVIGGYAFEIGDSAVQRIFDRIGIDYPLVFRTVCRKDSQELTHDDRYAIYDCCVNAPQQRILITHGTDTLLETANYLSGSSDLTSKIIVLTGAMKPETFKNSDADFNVGCAWGALQSLSTPGVYVSMNGLLATCDQIERDGVTGKFMRK